MADELIAERVQEAYIRPIRTVLAVDDDFHQYDAAKQGKDPDRAKAIWRACRKRGYLCDIDDGSDLIKGGDTNHLLKSDMVILDYHLRGDESKWSLGLLRRLSDSEHASLVVVYTKETNILSVRRAIAAHLLGCKAKDQWFSKPEFYDVWDTVADKLKEIPTEALIEAYVRGGKGPCRSDKRLQGLLKDLKVPGAAIPEVVDALYNTALIEGFGVEAGNPCKKPPFLGGGDKTPWVYANNLFVVCVVKTDENKDDGDLVFKELEKALGEWNPDFMMASVAYARGEFARGGFDHERSSLSDPSLQAGWLYHAWAGSIQEREMRLRVLFERIIRSYAGNVLDKVIEFGSKHVPSHESPAANLETLKAAIDHFCPTDRPTEESVLHVLNEYLVVEDLPGYVETGTIFAPAADGIKKGIVYLCVTPACDLVPRKPSGSWEKVVHPHRPMIAMKCKISDVTTDNLKIAEQSKCIYLTVGGKQKVVTLSDDKKPAPSLEWFFMDGMGKIAEDQTFAAVSFSRDKPAGAAGDGAFKADTMLMKAISQIRAVYANRIMQAAGQHMSRIGVDFVSYPKPPEEGD